MPRSNQSKNQINPGLDFFWVSITYPFDSKHDQLTNYNSQFTILFRIVLNSHYFPNSQTSDRFQND